MLVCWLTYTQSQVEQSHPDIQSEEQNNIGHFAEQDDVAHVLLHSYCQEQNTSGSEGGKSWDKPRKWGCIIKQVNHVNKSIQWSFVFIPTQIVVL